MVRKARPSWIEPLCLLAVVFYLLQLPQWLIFVRSINSVKTISFSLQFTSLIESHPELWSDFLAKDHIFVRKSCIENAQINMCSCCCQKSIPALYVVSSPDLLPFLKLKFRALTPQMGRKPPFNEIKNVIFEILAIFSFYTADKNFRVRGTLSNPCVRFAMFSIFLGIMKFC